MNTSKQTYNIMMVDDEIIELKNIIIKHPNSINDGNAIEIKGDQFNLIYFEKLEQAFKSIKFSEITLDCVLLDYHFRNSTKDGLWLAQKISYMCPNLPIIMLTQKYSITNAFSAGKVNISLFKDKTEYFISDDPTSIDPLFSEIKYSIEKIKKEIGFFDHEHLIIAEKYAVDGYDEGEQKYPATVAYYYFENELIKEIISSKLAANSKIRICDIGCGTGRIEEFILKEFRNDLNKIEVVGIDFAGKMLLKLENKNLESRGLNLIYERAVAENLILFEENQFDIIFMAFGLPSYTKYYLSIKEAYRIAKPDAICLFSVYNKESIIYDVHDLNAGFNRPIAAIADVERGKLNVGGDKEIDCEAFSVEEIQKLTSRFGWEEIKLCSFPTIHASVSNDYFEKLFDRNSNLPEFPFARNFSNSLYDLDKMISPIMLKGHYIVITARAKK